MNAGKEILKKSLMLEQFARRIRNIIPFHKRLSKDFWETYALLKEAETWDRNKLEEFQFKKIKDLLGYAYLHSGFYHRLYNEYDVDLNDIQSFSDFNKKIPLVTKNMLKEAVDLTIQHKQMMKVHTSGTTGSPFQFYIDRAGEAKELAAIYYQWSRIGFLPETKRIEMRGFQEIPIREYPDLNLTRFSIVNMDSHINEMVSYINQNKLQFIHGYPSAIVKFAKIIEKKSLKITQKIKGILLASENIYDWQYELIKKILQPAAIIGHYGNTEKVALGAWNGDSRRYHFLPLYSYVEKGNLGELVGTGFFNRATPFIRYQTTDILQNVVDEGCPDHLKCFFPVVDKIAGRIEDYLIDEKNEMIPPAAVTFPFKDLSSIEEVQIIQRKNRDITLKYTININKKNFLSVDKETLSQDFKKLLGPSIAITFEEVLKIKLADNCKFKWIVSEIND